MTSKLKHHIRKLKLYQNPYSRILAIIFVVIFAGIGAALLFFSHAASPPPTVTISSPAANAEVYGNASTINSTSTANDGGSIASSELLVNNSVVQTLTTAPYNFTLNTLTYPDGTYTLSVSSTDDQGDTATSSVSVYISNGDLNFDGAVNISDLAIMATNWGKTGQTYAQGAMNGTGIVNIQDLAILATNWGWSKSSGGGGGSNPLGLTPDPWWAGGNTYYNQFPTAAAWGWNSPSFFPIMAWDTNVSDASDASALTNLGVNTAINGAYDMTSVQNAHLSILSDPDNSAAEHDSPATVGFALDDEADGRLGAGNGPVGFDSTQTDYCTTSTPCGFTALQTINNQLPAFSNSLSNGGGRLRYAGYTQPVIFGPSADDTFLNGLLSSGAYSGKPYQDITAADDYWYSSGQGTCTTYHLSQYSPAIPSADCLRAANYGRTVDQLRQRDSLDGKYTPLTADVELSCNASASSPCITAPEVAGAVWSTLIHGAMEVLYFPEFSTCDGSTFSDSNALLNCPTGDAVPTVVKATDNEISTLAPVLNTQSMQYSFNSNLDTMFKYSNGSYYIFSELNNTSSPGSYTFTLPSGLSASSVKVLYDNDTTSGASSRTLPITSSNGTLTFTDSFAHEYTSHIYEITPSSSPTPSISGSPYTNLVFDDEFSGSSLDTSKWTAVNRYGDPSNNEIGCYNPSNVTESGGYLNILTKVQSTTCSYINDGTTAGFPKGPETLSSQYTSGMVQWSSYNIKYGTLEYRAKEAGGTGTWPAQWMMGSNCQAVNPVSADNITYNGSTCAWPTVGSQENDITEIVQQLGKTSTDEEVIWGQNSDGSLNYSSCSSTSCPTISDVSQNWHTYDMVWAPGQVTYYIDGKQTFQINNSSIPSTPMFLIMNTAVGGNGGGTVNDSTLPQTLSIDYVRVFQ